jgi:hypothetical protein
MPIFFDLSNFKGFPPKNLVAFWNTKTDFLADLLNSKLIKDFINADEYSQIACLRLPIF